MTCLATKPRVAAFALACLVSSYASELWAEQDAKCIGPFENAQRLRKEGKLVGASEALIACSQPSCPGFIAKECMSWYSEVQASLPSVVLSAKDGDQLLREVRVYMDGTLMTEQSTGRALPVDPGQHEFQFEVPGRAPVTHKVLIVEGEKNRLISAQFSADPAPAAEPSAPPAPGAPDAEPRRDARAQRRSPIAAYVVGGAGLAAVGAGVALRLIAAGEYDDLDRDCKPACAQDDVDRVALKYTVSDVALGVGGAALITSGILLLVGQSSSGADRGALSFAPTASGTGAELGWFGRF